MMLFKSGASTSLKCSKVSYCVLRNIRSYPLAASSNLNPLEEIPKEIQREKLLYNTIINGAKQISHVKKLKLRKKADREKYNAECIQPLPIALKYVMENDELVNNEVERHDQPSNEVSHSLTQFPYSQRTNKYSFEINKHESNMRTAESARSPKYSEVEAEIRARYDKIKNMNNWMTAYDNFEFDLATIEPKEEPEDLSINYGTPNPKSKISKVPCGGCGALLHCKDTSIPGYIPSEIFKNANKNGAASLQAIMCQRCHFLKEYNIALQVQVRPEDYTQILKAIPKDSRKLILLMIDLMDFPCSMWPGIADLLGPSTPIYVVGNKVDLLPKDCKSFLKNVKQKLWDELKLNGFGAAKILDISLISAKTGYGIEDLITSLFSKWGTRGDVYLLGCTNVGKSSLFNALIQSDYCKSQASNLIQRATVSQWPGTTLNMLKFPIMRPSPHRLYERHYRIKALQQITSKESELRQMELKVENNAQNATLIGYIGRTLSSNRHDKTPENFSSTGHDNASGKSVMGIDENNEDYALSKWCYDTPGVMQPEQILNILTVDELMYTVPKELIRPETFCLWPGTTLFIAGLARLDFLEGVKFARVTVFRSNLLPITVCRTANADEIYKEYLGTPYFKVPIKDGDRLSKWPGLKPSKILSVHCPNPKESSKDIVLSSAGWIAVNTAHNGDVKFRAWTPDGKGIHLRDCILPKAVKLRGGKIRGTVAYFPHKFI